MVTRLLNNLIFFLILKFSNDSCNVLERVGQFQKTAVNLTHPD